MTPDPLTYVRSECACFRKTAERHGGLSNMSSGYPLRVNGTRILTTEALYQACKFPDNPDLQKCIIAERSPMSAKMIQKPFGNQIRPDWDDVRIAVMDWCLRLKLAQNPVSFGNTLRATGDLLIVEDSRKDAFWGAIPSADDATLTGRNVLGALLTALRHHWIQNNCKVAMPKTPELPNFKLFGQPVSVAADPEPGLSALDFFNAAME